MHCCEHWKTIYENFKAVVNEAAEGNEKRKWTFTETRIFAKIDAFVQRCANMGDICEG
jgi:dynein heavy chain